MINMPRFDGTGPMGIGPLTGRGMGPCGGGMRRSMWRGFGRGFGFGRRWTQKDEEGALKEEIEILEEELSEAKKDLESLKGQKK